MYQYLVLLVLKITQLQDKNIYKKMYVSDNM